MGIGVDSGDLSFPALDKLAAAYGYPTCQQGTTASWGGCGETLGRQRDLLICEVFVSMDQNFEPKSSAKRLPDGTMVSPPLEDLSPFLPDEEMDENMIIPRIKG